MSKVDRRTLLKAGLVAALMPAMPGLVRAQVGAPARPVFKPQSGDWRTFEVTTTVVLPRSDGETRLWLPVSSLNNAFQHTLDNKWAGNATATRLTNANAAQMLVARFSVGQEAPMLTLTSRIKTRNRSVDWSRRSRVREDAVVLRRFLQPTSLQPTDGIVRATALAATRGAETDVDKVRALYRWVVTNCHREPKTRGCGSGDIVALLTEGGLGGKCADLNALFVAMARSVGVPARDIYGLRVAPSAFDYRELGGNPARLAGAQHCRAEVWLNRYGWVAMDPADVLKVMRQEKAQWIKDLKDPLIEPVNASLFGSWEGNWIGYNTAHDIDLPGSPLKTRLPFLMYPQAENKAGRFDELAPDKFTYAITAREIIA